MAAKRERIDIRMNELVEGDLWVRRREPIGTHWVTGLEKAPEDRLLVHYVRDDGSPGEYLGWMSTHAVALRQVPRIDTLTGNEDG